MTTPFWPAGAPYLNADPGVVQPWRTDSGMFWLGNPATGLIQLPSPHPDGYSAAATSGEVVQGLMAGGAALTRFSSVARAWSLSWPRLAGRDWQIVNGFYRRLFGADPWAFLPPEDLNRLTLARSLCGSLNSVAEGWTPTYGTVIYDPTQTPAITPSGVLRWSGSRTGSRLVAGGATPAGTETCNPAVAVPAVDALPMCGSMWVAAATGTCPVSARLVGVSADGTTATADVVTGPTVTCGTAPALVTVAAGINAFPNSAFAVLELYSRMSAAPDLLVSAAQLTYDSGPDTWGVGAGVPQVILSAGLGRAPDVRMSSAATMTLLEALPGAA